MASAVRVMRTTPPPSRLPKTHWSRCLGRVGENRLCGSATAQERKTMARMQRLDVRGRTTVITGAASGMGAEVARELDRRGARLALLDRNADGLAALIRTLAGTGHTTHVIDLTDDDAVFALVGELEASHPRVQALVTCAGSSMLGDIDQLTMEEMRWLVEVNLWGTVNITKALLPP